MSFKLLLSDWILQQLRWNFWSEKQTISTFKGKKIAFWTNGKIWNKKDCFLKIRILNFNVLWLLSTQFETKLIQVRIYLVMSVCFVSTKFFKINQRTYTNFHFSSFRILFTFSKNSVFICFSDQEIWTTTSSTFYISAFITIKKADEQKRIL